MGARRLMPGEKWARRVVKGQEPAGKKIVQLCKRQLGWLRNRKKLGIEFDYDDAEAACLFFPVLRHWKGELGPSIEHPEGQPFTLDPFQEFFVGQVIGWKWAETGYRVIREALLYMAKKGGKSHLLGPLVVLLTFFDNEPGAEGYVAAAKRDQTKHVFGTVERMVKSSAELAALIKSGRNTMYDDRTGSTLIAVSSDANTEDGANPYVAAMDEVHRLKNRKLIDVMEKGAAGRRQSLILYGSTAGEWRPESPLAELVDLGTKILDGVLEEMSFFPMMFELDEGDDWRDESVWHKANPIIGRSPKWDVIRSIFNKAQLSPTAQTSFRRFHLNETVNGAERAIDMDAWAACGGELPDLTGRTCYAALDLAHTSDLSSLVLSFPDDDEGGLVHWISRHWIPEADIETRSANDRVPYDRWAEAGTVIATPGNATDFDAIRKGINELAEEYEIRAILYDPRLATQLSIQLEGDGLAPVAFTQSFTNYAEPCEEFERLLRAGLLRHGDCPALRWMASNLVFRTNADGYKRPDKARSRERIDGIVAGIMTLAGPHLALEDVPEDPYSSGKGIVA